MSRLPARCLVRTLAACVGAAAIVTTAACGSSTNNSLTSSAPTSSTPTGPAAGTLADWGSSGGLDAMNKISSDLNAVSTDAGAQDIAALGSDCAQLGVDVTRAQNLPPMPDGTMQEHWSKALTDLADAATECVNGAQNRDVSQLDRSATDLGAAGAEITILDTAMTRTP